MQIVSIAVLVKGINRSFFYHNPNQDSHVGDLLHVNFNGKKAIGVCLETQHLEGNTTTIVDGNKKLAIDKIKPIKETIKTQFLSPTNLNFYRNFAQYNLNSLNSTLQMAISSSNLSAKGLQLSYYYYIANHNYAINVVLWVHNRTHLN